MEVRAIDSEPSSSPKASGSRRRLALVVENATGEHARLVVLARGYGLDVVHVVDVDSALTTLRGRAPDLILLDLSLPVADGLRLVSRIREEHPFIPMVVVPARQELADVEEVLDLGAANFLHRPIRDEEFRFVLDHVSRTLEEEEGLRKSLVPVMEHSTRMILRSDPSLLPRVIAYLGREIRSHYPQYTIPLPDIKLALYEALANAVEHGNLEIGYEGKSEAMSQANGLRELTTERLRTSPYADRRIHVSVVYRFDEVEYRIGDEGCGFDPTTYDAARALANTERLHGRGLALIRHYVDEVSWNEAGTEIRMICHLGPRRPPEPPLPEDSTP